MAFIDTVDMDMGCLARHCRRLCFIAMWYWVLVVVYDEELLCTILCM